MDSKDGGHRLMLVQQELECEPLPQLQLGPTQCTPPAVGVPRD